MRYAHRLLAPVLHATEIRVFCAMDGDDHIYMVEGGCLKETGDPWTIRPYGLEVTDADEIE